MRTLLPVTRTLHEDQLEPLVRRTLDGEPRAWGAFWLEVDPTIETIAGRFRASGLLASREDERRAVVVRVMEHLRDREFALLRNFHAVLQRRDGSFRAWLAVVTRRTALNHARDHAENIALAESPTHRRWVELLPLPDEIGADVPFSTRAVRTAEVLRIEAYVEENIPPKPRQALRLWLMGYSRAEIANALGLEKAKDADILVRTTLMHLRRRFSGPDDDALIPELHDDSLIREPDDGSLVREPGDGSLMRQHPRRRARQGGEPRRSRPEGPSRSGTQ